MRALPTTENSPQMPFIFAVSDFRVVFKGVKLQKYLD